MYLHNDKDIFERIIGKVHIATKLDSAIIEKDYYVTLFLKKLVEKEPSLIFKGGTSLSKCYKIIERFSEDIDLNLDQSNGLSQGRRKHFKEHIVDTIDELGLTFANPEQTRSRRDYNKYIIDFPTITSGTMLKQHLLVETVYTISAFPVESMPATSIIYDYLKEHGFDDVIDKYELAPFYVTVQTLERTFADKIFALCDYYLDGRIEAHSRHLYDLYKMQPHIELDSDFKRLFKEVQAVRSIHKHCPSASHEKSIPQLLKEIIENQTYKKDYEIKTKPLLYDGIPYDETIKTIKSIFNFLSKSEMEM